MMLHLTGLYLTLELDWPATTVTRSIRQVADRATGFPHLEVPSSGRHEPTIYDVVTADVLAPAVGRWGAAVWGSWRPHHSTAKAFAVEYLGLPES